MNLAKRSLQAARRLAGAPLSPGQALLLAMLLFGALLCLAMLASRPEAWYAEWVPIISFCRAWTQGDWLINYNGGFVRRGLAGSLLIPAAEWLNDSPLSAVAGIQVAFYLLIILMAIHLLRHPKPAPFALALALLSPAALFFQLEDIDRGRKEVALIAWVAVLAWRAAERRPPLGRAGLAISLLALALLHDGLFFFFPGAILVLMLLDPEEPWGFRGLLWALAPSLALMALIAWQGPSSEKQLRLILSRFHGSYAYWADSSIGYLRYGLGWAAQDAITNNLSFRLAFMPMTLLLGSLPLLAWLWAEGPAREALKGLWQRPQARAMAAAFALCQAVLFTCTTDWGRWLSIDLLMAAFALLALHQRSASPAQARPSAPWLLLIVSLILYVGAWRMHPLCNALFMNDPFHELKMASPPLLHATRMLP
jgi:hypothetical protein